MRNIPFNKPSIVGCELDNLLKAVDLGQLSGDGKFTRECNRRISEMTGGATALITHSCTAALEMAALLCDLAPGDEVITFVNRNLEPYRGYHIFMRALPAILDARPDCHVVIVGAEGSAYGPPSRSGTSYRQRYLDEVADQLDMSRVHFTGTLAHADYVRVLQVSRLHVYLTYPFILSWSMLEAMSAGCLVLGRRAFPT